MESLSPLIQPKKKPSDVYRLPWKVSGLHVLGVCPTFTYNLLKISTPAGLQLSHKHWSRTKKDVHLYLEYSWGYGEEYQVWISYLPNSMTEGHRTCGSGGPVTPTFYARKKDISMNFQLKDLQAEINWSVSIYPVHPTQSELKVRRCRNQQSHTKQTWFTKLM